LFGWNFEQIITYPLLGADEIIGLNGIQKGSDHHLHHEWQVFLKPSKTRKSEDVHLFSELQISLNLRRKTDVHPTPIMFALKFCPVS
jgi:hypothetical protein